MVSAVVTKSLIRLAELSNLASRITKKRPEFILYEPLVEQSGDFLHIKFRDTVILIGKKNYHFRLMNYLEVIDTRYWEVISVMKQTGLHGDIGYEIVCKWIR